MFVRDPFDIAPGASPHTRASWVTLAVGLLFALACAWLLDRSIRTVRVAQFATEDARRTLESQTQKEAARRLKQNDPAALERVKAQQSLQRMLRMSWSGLFDALESAGQEVGGRAAIVSLTPVKTQADSAEVGLAGLAVTNQVMIDYIRALERDPHVRQVQLSMQQPATSNGAEVVRFQLSLLWEPAK